MENLQTFFSHTGFAHITFCQLVMILIGLSFIYVAIRRELKPILLIPIGFGILFGNISFPGIGFQFGLNDGIISNWYLPLIFLGIGAMADSSSLITNPKLMLLGIVAPFGILIAYLLSLIFGFDPVQAGAISLIGAVDVFTGIFLSSQLAPELIGTMAVITYLYIILMPVIQPVLMQKLTTTEDRKIRMKTPRAISQTEKVIFPLIGLLLTCLLAPAALPLLGMLFFGNLLRESGIARKLAETARGPIMNIVVILLGITVGASTQASGFLTMNTLKIILIGLISFIITTVGGVLFVKFLNLFLKTDNKINPLIGSAGLAALPDAAYVSKAVGLKSDSSNYLLMHAIGANIAGFIGSVVTAGILLMFLK